jgi:hypothetical protein
MADEAESRRRLRFRTHPVAWEDLDSTQVVQHMAMHEAGHAVVGLAHGMSLLDIVIQSEPVAHPDGGFVFGGARFDAPDGDMNEWAKARPAETAVVLMAGMCAEEVVLGCHLSESWMGDVRIARIGHGWIGYGTADQSRMFGYINDAHDEVAASEAGIRTVANALLQTGRLTADEIALLM